MNKYLSEDVLKKKNSICATAQYFEIDYPHGVAWQNKDDVELFQFKVVRELIVENQTLFLNPHVNLRPNSYTNYAFNYRKNNVRATVKATSLLDFLILNPKALKLFYDEKLVNEIKPLVQNALTDSHQSKILKTLFFQSLHNTTSAEFLLECGLDANTLTEEKASALMLTNNSGVIKALIKYGADTAYTLHLGDVHYELFGRSVSPSTHFQDKNAFEIHSILHHSAAMKILAQYEKKELATEGNHFYDNYLSIKEEPTVSSLIKAMKANNPIVFDKLEEFKDTLRLSRGNYSFLASAISLNKQEWVQKVLDIENESESSLFKKSEQYKNTNVYLALAIYHQNYKIANMLLKAQSYEDNKELIDLVNKSYDPELIQSYYNILSSRLTLTQILRGTNLELLKKTLPNFSRFNETFEMFCDTLVDDTNTPIFSHLRGDRLKSGLIDCLIYMVQAETLEDEKTIKQDYLIKACFSLSQIDNADRFTKAMKQKAQKLLKAFPNRQDSILAELSHNYPDIVSEIEQKQLNKRVNNEVKEKPRMQDKTPKRKNKI